MTDNHDYLWQRRYDIKKRALINRLYYQERQRIFESREGIIKAFSIVAGSIAFARISDPYLIQWCAAIITLGSTVSLVFGYGNKARDSVKRSAEWAQLEREIDQVGERDYTEAQLNGWFAQANDLEASEPSAHRILFERCYERTVENLGGTAEGIRLNFITRHCPIINLP